MLLALGEIRVGVGFGRYGLRSGHVSHGGSGADLRWSEAKFDNGAGVGHQLGLPAVIGLELLHGGLGGGVPVAACLGHIAGVDKRLLNLGGTLIVDGALAGVFCNRFRLLMTAGLRETWGDTGGQCSCKK